MERKRSRARRLLVPALVVGTVIALKTTGILEVSWWWLLLPLTEALVVVFAATAIGTWAVRTLRRLRDQTTSVAASVPSPVESPPPTL